jgi:hypothetical protein
LRSGSSRTGRRVRYDPCLGRLEVELQGLNMQSRRGMCAAGIVAVLLMAAPGQVEREENGPTGPTNSGFRTWSVRTTTSTRTGIRDRGGVAEQVTSSRRSSRSRAPGTSTRTTNGTPGSPSSGFRFPRTSRAGSRARWPTLSVHGGGHGAVLRKTEGRHMRVCRAVTTWL